MLDILRRRGVTDSGCVPSSIAFTDSIALADEPLNTLVPTTLSVLTNIYEKAFKSGRDISKYGDGSDDETLKNLIGGSDRCWVRVGKSKGETQVNGHVIGVIRAEDDEYAVWNTEREDILSIGSLEDAVEIVKKSNSFEGFSPRVFGFLNIGEK